MACQGIPSDGAFARAAIGFFDCQAQVIGSQGFAALATPSSSVSLLLTSLIAIFVALVGIRMLLGHGPTLQEGVVSAAKLGFVLALTTAWPAYQTLAFDVVLKGPAEIVSEVGGAAGVPGASGGLVGRLDATDRAFERFSVLGVGMPQVALGAPKLPPPLFIGFDTFAVGAARALFLAAAIGAFAFLRLGAGIFLGIGPLFVAFLLFDPTRWLFEGWLRALITLTLGAIASALMLGVELAFLEPWLLDLLARRGSGYAVPEAGAQLLAISLVFAVVLAAMLALIARLSFTAAPGATISRVLASADTILSTRVGADGDRRFAAPASAVGDRPSRAALTSRTLETIARREQAMRQIPGSQVNMATSSTIPQNRPGGVATPSPRGSAWRGARRVSASARRRDGHR